MFPTWTGFSSVSYALMGRATAMFTPLFSYPYTGWAPT